MLSKRSVYSPIMLFLLLGLFLIAGMHSPSYAAEKAAERPYNIVILGDSLSAGLGVEPEQAYPSLIQSHFEKTGKDHIKIFNGSALCRIQSL